MAYSIFWNVDADGNWGTAADWNTGVLPGASDDVDIDTADFHTVTYSSGTSSINSLNVGNDAFTMTGGSLSIAAASNFAHALTLGGLASLTLNGNTTVSGLFTVSLGDVSGTGTLTLAGGGDIQAELTTSGSGTIVMQGATSVDGGDILADNGRILENQGTLTFANHGPSTVAYIDLGNGDSPFVSSATLNNDVGATIVFSANTCEVLDSLGTGTTFTNAGTLENINNASSIIGVAFVNTGSVSVTTGELNLNGGGSSAVSGISVVSGASLMFSGSSAFTLNGGGTLGSAGSTVDINGGSLSTTASTNFGGALTMEDTGHLSLAGNTTVNGSFYGILSLISGSGTLTLAGGSVLDAAMEMVGSGTTILQGTTTGLGELYADGGRVLENQGTFTVNSVSLGDSVFDPAVGGGTLKNDFGATIIFSNGSFVASNLGTVSFINNGTMDSNGPATNDIYVPFINTGSVDVQTGELDVIAAPMTGNGTVEVDSGATFVLNEFATSAANNVNISSGTGIVQLTGGTGVDTFGFAIASLSSADTVNGGTGASLDRLAFTTAGTIASSVFTNVTHIEQITLANGTNSLTLSNALVGSADDNHILYVYGNAGNDTINASGVSTAANRVSFNSGAGNDTLTGGAGADYFSFTVANLTSADTVNGGSGASIDVLAFTTAGTISASAFTNVTQIESITLANGTNNVSLSDGLVGSANDSHLLTVTGNAGNDTIDASAVTTAANRVTFSSGSGNDTLTGGAGADTFNFAAADLTSADTVNGGTGASLDRLNFTTAGTIATSAFANVTHIEQITLANGTNNLTLSDALVGSADDNHILSVYGNAGNDTIDASGVTTATNRVLFNSGAGNDTLNGGAGADYFSFTAANLTSGDTVNGGTGASYDVLAFTTAGTIAASAFTNVTHIESITLANGTNNVSLSDGLVGTADDSSLLTITGNAGNDTIDASAVTTAANRVVFNSGAGNDTLTGGAGADTFSFTIANLTSADIVNGGTGVSLDRLTVTTAGTILASAFTNVSHIEQIVLANADNTVTLTDAMVGSADDNHVLSVYGYAGNDTIDASGVTTATNRVAFYSGTGVDTLTGGAGADYFSFAGYALNPGTDTINGGTGPAIDVLAITSPVTQYSGGVDPLAHVTHIEQIDFLAPGSQLSLSDALVGSADDGHLLTVLGSSGTDGISASAVTTATNRVDFIGGGGADIMQAGAGADIFTYLAASDSTGRNFDTIWYFNFGADRFDIPGLAGTITAIDAANTTGTLDYNSNFDTEMTADEASLGAHHAQLFTPNSGSESGQTFLIVDLNGIAGYQAGADLVIYLYGTTGTLTTADFT